MYVNIDEFSEIKECLYKGEKYSVRDNGAIFRHALIPSMPRKLDEQWTFGKKDAKTGYMMWGGHRVHIIVARAFYGERDSKEYVVDHIDTNRCNNRKENLRWFTRLENALNNPITRKKITYLCGGDIQKFIDNPSCLKNVAGIYQDVMWMRTVTKEEAKSAYERIMHWATTTTLPSLEKKEVGEWVYKPFQPFEEGENIKAFVSNYKVVPKEENNIASDDSDNEYLTKSLTPNVFQRNWSTPTEFPLCPQTNTSNIILDYYANLKINKEFCFNKLWRSSIADFSISEEKDKIWVLCDNGTESVKRWALVEITFEKEYVVHTTIGTFFHQDGAMKSFTLVQGKEWHGGEVFDDYC